MSAVLDYLPFPKLSLPKRVIIQNRRLNYIYYLAHIPIIVYAVLFFFINMGYTEEIPNNPATLIFLDQVNVEPFKSYRSSDAEETISDFCTEGGTANCSDSEDLELCTGMFGSLLESPFSMMVEFKCSRLCPPAQNAVDSSCFQAPSKLVSQGSQQVEVILATTTPSAVAAGGQGASGGSGGSGIGSGGIGSRQLQTSSFVLTAEHLQNPMMGLTVFTFSYAFKLARPAPFLFGLEDSGKLRTNRQANTALVDTNLVVVRVFAPAETINMTLQELVQAGGGTWNQTIMFQGSEFIVTTNCFTASRDLPALYWSGLGEIQPSEEMPLCLMTFAWLLQESVTYSADGGFGRTVKLRLMAERGSSFSRLPSIQFTLLNLVSLLVLMGIPPAFTGWLARTVLGPLSRIYSRALQEYFDLPTQLASAGLKAIATLAAFGNLSNTSLSKEELRTCFHELMGSSNLQMEEKDLNRLTNFVFEKDPRYPNGPRNKPFPKLEEGDDSQEPRVDAARFAISTSFRDPISLEDMQNLFDSRRDRKLLERVFTPGAVNEALRDQPVLELPLWKKQLLGVPVEKDEKEILGEDMSPAADETNTRKVQPEEPQIRDTMESGAYNAEVKQTLTMVTMQLQAAAAEVEAVKEAKSRVGEVDDKHSEAMKDLLLRVCILEDSHAGGADKGVPPLPGEPSSDAWRRIESLESRNRTISAENQELKRQMLDLRQQQAQLVSRCDRQFKSMQELTTLLKNMAERPAPAAAAQEPSLLPTSCFTSAPAGSFAQRRI